jgi:hypothetical protein
MSKVLGLIYLGNIRILNFSYSDDEFICIWVDDMEFSTPPEVSQAIKDRVDKKIFGYTMIYESVSEPSGMCPGTLGVGLAAVACPRQKGLGAVKSEFCNGLYKET